MTIFQRSNTRSKGIEPLQRSEPVIQELLQFDAFTKADIYRYGVSKTFVGRFIHRLVKEETLQMLSESLVLKWWLLLLPSWALA